MTSVHMPLSIVPLTGSLVPLSSLAELLIETVAKGGSVSFMHPLSTPDAQQFWEGALHAASLGERIILVALEGAQLVGTVTLLLNCPPNQPHRAEIAKLMTRAERRGRGIGRALVEEAEKRAVQLGRFLITLDTASEQGAAGFYEKLGYQRAGEIPYYAYKPHGGLTGTILYWKQLGPLQEFEAKQ